MLQYKNGKRVLYNTIFDLVNKNNYKELAEVLKEFKNITAGVIVISDIPVVKPATKLIEIDSASTKLNSR